MSNTKTVVMLSYDLENNSTNSTNYFIKNLLEVENKLAHMYNFINIIITNKNNLNIQDNSFTILNDSKDKCISDKLNNGLKYCKNINYDYVFIMETNNIIDAEILDAYYYYMDDNYDFINLLNMYYYNIDNKQLYFWNGFVEDRKNDFVSIGKCLSKSLISKLNYNGWESNLNTYLDLSLINRLKRLDNIQDITLDIKNFGFACEIISNSTFNQISKIKKLCNLQTSNIYYKYITNIINSTINSTNNSTKSISMPSNIKTNNSNKFLSTKSNDLVYNLFKNTISDKKVITDVIHKLVDNPNIIKTVMGGQIQTSQIVNLIMSNPSLLKHIMDNINIDTNKTNDFVQNIIKNMILKDGFNFGLNKNDGNNIHDHYDNDDDDNDNYNNDNDNDKDNDNYNNEHYDNNDEHYDNNDNNYDEKNINTNEFIKYDHKNNNYINNTLNNTPNNPPNNAPNNPPNNAPNNPPNNAPNNLLTKTKNNLGQSVFNELKSTKKIEKIVPVVNNTPQPVSDHIVKIKLIQSKYHKNSNMMKLILSNNN